MTHQEVFDGLRNGTITDAQLDAVCDAYGVKRTGTPNQKRAWLRTKLANVEDLSADSPYRPRRGGGGAPAPAPVPPAPDEEDPMNLCPYCPAQFADIADLGTHIRDVHMASAPPTPPAGGGGGTPPTTTPERPRKMPLIWYRRKLAEQMIERLQDEGRTVDAQEAHHETIPANQVVEVEAINGDDNNVMVTVSMGKEPAPPEPAPTPTPDPAEQLETAQPTETKDNAVKRFLRWTDS